VRLLWGLETVYMSICVNRHYTHQSTTKLLRTSLLQCGLPSIASLFILILGTVPLLELLVVRGIEGIGI
jgi:hypothetical protein